MLDKAFAPASFEARLYDTWERSGAFACDPDSAAAPFTIMIPPPNVTGSLHIGHALTFTLQDTLIRWRRMQGRDALWQPGTDHAGIATQMVVERLLAEQGGPDRATLGREAFVERVWAWKRESGGTITRQLRRLGASLDWARERFTLDEGLSRAVRAVFVRLHREGLIYRDRRLVNWDPKLGTAISDLEVESREVRGQLWYLRYPIQGLPNRHIVVATTRPETLLGDVAIAVHPDDARFADLVGRHAVLPLVGRRLPIVADAFSDPEKGSGAVKITPAHDFGDFEVGRRHGLPMPSVLDAEARVTVAELGDALRAVEGVADPAFVRALDGLDRFAARERIVDEIERLGLLERAEPHVHQVPHGDRGGVPIEPQLTLQWYCDAATLAKPAVAAVQAGRTVFVPKQWENTFHAWMRDIQPWCISRQLWWGHRIPAWHAADGRVFVAESAAEAQAAAGPDVALAQDPDVLDTWFSSALWPFSTLGWPDGVPEVPRYYPGDVLVTGFDIIFFWVARMMMMGEHVMGREPFRTVYIHGLVRDERGQKMSKSKGNVMDPLELIDAYGADALRWAIVTAAGPGRDMKLGRKRVEDARAFATKLWNAARFCEANGIGPAPKFDPTRARVPLARWILDAANRAVLEADAALEAFRFDEYAAAAYRFTWGTFCDWFLEFAKPVLFGPESAEREEVRQAAGHVMGLTLRLLHPAMPFITEELWGRFGYGAEGSLIRAAWPRGDSSAAPATEIEIAQGLIDATRRVRAEMNVPAAARPTLVLALADAGLRDAIDRATPAILRMAQVAGIETVDDLAIDARAKAAAHFAVPPFAFTAMLPLEGLIDFAAERARLGKERARADAEATKIAAKLGNADFVSRAPDEVVEENRERLDAARTELARLDAALARLG